MPRPGRALCNDGRPGSGRGACRRVLFASSAGGGRRPPRNGPGHHQADWGRRRRPRAAERPAEPPQAAKGSRRRPSGRRPHKAERGAKRRPGFFRVVGAQSANEGERDALPHWPVFFRTRANEGEDNPCHSGAPPLHASAGVRGGASRPRRARRHSPLPTLLRRHSRPPGHKRVRGHGPELLVWHGAGPKKNVALPCTHGAATFFWDSTVCTWERGRHCGPRPGAFVDRSGQQRAAWSAPLAECPRPWGPRQARAGMIIGSEIRRTE